MKLKNLLILAPLGFLPLFSQPCQTYVPTTCANCTMVQDVLYAAFGARANGSLTVSWTTTFVSSDGRENPASCFRFDVIMGVVNISLEPNIGASPINTSYTVTYNISGISPNISETWVIPPGSPIPISSVRIAPPPLPSFVIGLSQIGGAINGDCMVGVGVSWFALPCPGGGGSGITQLTGPVTAGPGSGVQATTITPTAVTPGTYGNGTNVGQFTVAADGRITGASNIAITGGGATSTTQLTDLTPVRTSATVLTFGAGCAPTTPCNVGVNGFEYQFITSGTITNSAGSGLTIRAYITDGSDGQSPGAFIVLNSGASGVTCSGCTVINSTSSFPQLCGSVYQFSWTATGTPGQWDTSGYADFREFQAAGCRYTPGTNITMTPSTNGVAINSTGGGSGLNQLTGDVTAGPGTGSQAATVVRVNGITYSATAAAHSVEVVTTANTTATSKVIPDCTDSAGQHINYTQSSDAFSCGTSSSGGSGGYTSSIGTTAAITQTGSDVTIYSVSSVPALSSGSCYMVQVFLFNNTGGPYTAKLYVDSSSVLTLFNTVSSAGENDTMLVSYCNNVGVQNAQVALMLPGSGYCTGANCNAGNAWTNYNYFAIPTTPTGVDWSMTHTVSIRTNAASGTVTGRMFRIGL